MARQTVRMRPRQAGKQLEVIRELTKRTGMAEWQVTMLVQDGWEYSEVGSTMRWVKKR